MASRAWTRRERRVALAEAIEAAGPGGLGAIRNHVDASHPDYPWQPAWHSEIHGATIAQRVAAEGPTFHRLRTPEASASEEAAPEANAAQLDDASPAGFDPYEIQRARTFAAAISGGAIEEARTALEFLRSFGDLAPIESALDTWAEMLDAVEGDAGAADRVLAVVADRLGSRDFPRLAVATADECRDAA